MPDWKTKLIQAYRLISAPYRKFRWMNLEANGRVPVIVLFYHRVADGHPNDWSMSRSSFEQQIDWFQERFDIVDLEECQRRIRSQHNARPTLAITFDDGYAENNEFALPLLIERRIPATYFVTTYHTTHQAPFPHDVEAGTPLPVNDIASLRALDMAGIEIGAHTRTHADLGKITDPKQLADEVIVASLEMQALLGRKIRYFAFPFGQTANLNRDAHAMLKEAGFLGVCSAYGGWNEIGEDAFHLQRLHGDPNFERMKNWLSFDPRIAKTPRFDFHGGSCDPAFLQQVIAETQTRVEQAPANQYVVRSAEESDSPTGETGSDTSVPLPIAGTNDPQVPSSFTPT